MNIEVEWQIESSIAIAANRSGRLHYRPDAANSPSVDDICGAQARHASPTQLPSHPERTQQHHDQTAPGRVALEAEGADDGFEFRHGGDAVDEGLE